MIANITANLYYYQKGKLRIRNARFVVKNLYIDHDEKRYRTMNNRFPNVKWFKPSEFDSPDQPGTGHGINIILVFILDKIRISMNRRIDINSGVRTKKHNSLVGGKDDSAHLDGNAADVNCPDNNFRFSFIFWAMAYGIKRIIIYKTFIHVDVDINKPHPIIMLGE